MFFINYFLIFLGLKCQQIVAITGGFRSDDNIYSNYIVSLRDSAGHTCGGVILSDRLIITAAHCFDKTEQTEYVVMGKRRLDDTNPKIEIKKIIKHPSFNPVFYKADIALVYLANSLNLNEFLPLDVVAPVAGEKCLAIGWGRIAMPGPYDDELIFANFEVAPLRCCFLSTIYTRGQLCFHDPDDSTKAVLDGDDGGPLICHGALAGIISYTSYPSKVLNSIATFLGIIREAAILKPVSYATDVVYFADWILDETDKLLE